MPKAAIAQLQLMQELHHILGELVQIIQTLPVAKGVVVQQDMQEMVALVDVLVAVLDQAVALLVVLMQVRQA
jgi:hypothetical protein